MGKQHLHVSTNMLAGWSGKMFLSSAVSSETGEKPPLFRLKTMVRFVGSEFILNDINISWVKGETNKQSFRKFSCKHGLFFFFWGGEGCGKPSKTDRNFSKKRMTCTLPETNMAPEKRRSQKETGITTINFQVLC